MLFGFDRFLNEPPVIKAVSKILNLPKDLVPVTLIPIGFSGEESRKSLKEIIFKQV
ncbi:hypothetical protein HYU93_02770 [Candidatus Daviesbacteria bacterium]|nr:hypothetical protein [Candidatus Daviesbacteria bacterium]